MKRFIEGDDRTQRTLFPASLDEYIDDENMVHVIDAFVDALDLGDLDFKGVVPEATGRPSYHPSVLLKIYVYGYLNRIASSRRLERETQRNIEMMWLTGRLMPDFKTIANFRKENAKEATGVDDLTVVVDRGYYEGEQIRACDEADITIFVPKPLTSGSKAKGRFGKQDFVYLPDEDVYRCPADEKLTWRFKRVERGKMLHRYWTTACAECALKEKCTTAPWRRISRWEHEAVLEAAQRRLDLDPEKMAVRRCSAEHPLRHAQGLDGRNPLSHPNAGTGERRDEPARARLQHETDDQDLGHRAIVRGYPGVRRSSNGNFVGDHGLDGPIRTIPRPLRRHRSEKRA